MRLLLSILALTWTLLGAAEPSPRPKIEDVAATALPYSPPAGWHLARVGVGRLLMELRAFYPEDHIFFIARDGEYAYDAARMFLADDPEALKRIHLLNISREHIHSPRFKKYLKESGLTEGATKGRKIVLVDSGYVGTVPLAIREAVSARLRAKIHPHFILSGNPTVPSSRFFISGAGGNVLGPAEKMRKVVNEFEHLPHHEGKGYDYAEDADGNLVAISKTDSPANEKQAALDLMSDLKWFASQEASAKQFKWHGENLRLVADAFRGKRSFDDADVLTAIANLERFVGIDGFYADLNDLDLKHRLEISPEAITHFVARNPKYAPIFNSAERQIKTQLEAAYPKLKEFLQRPWETIPDLDPSKKKDRELIKQLISLRSEELYSILSSEVLSQPGAEEHPELVRAMLQDPASHRWLIATVLSKPFWLKSDDGIDLVAEMMALGSSDRRIVDSILSQELMAKNPRGLELLEAMIRRGKAKENMTNNLFSKDWWKKQPTLLRLTGGAEPTLQGVLAALAMGHTLTPTRQECDSLIGRVRF